MGGEAILGDILLSLFNLYIWCYVTTRTHEKKDNGIKLLQPNFLLGSNIPAITNI